MFVRVLLQTGWHALRQATHRRTALLRAVGVCSRSRLRSLRLALHHWRIEAAEVRRAQARAHAGRAVLAACLAGARGRVMRPAWENWRELVRRERDEEDEFAGREEGLLAFAAALTRVGRRKDRARKHQALVVWRIGAARAVASVAQQQAVLRAEVAAVEYGKVRDCAGVLRLQAGSCAITSFLEEVVCKARPPAVHASCASCEELEQYSFVCACSTCRPSGARYQLVESSRGHDHF